MADVSSASIPEVSALAKHHCPGCGSEARWDAGKQALVCPYCGTVSPAELASDGSIVKEHDLALALRAIPDLDRGWESDRTPVRCGNCAAISLFEPTRMAQRCEFCGSAAVVPQAASQRPIRPESVLPFAVPEAQARELACQWVGRGASVASATGLYVPYWRLACEVYVHWHAVADYGTKDRPDYAPVDGGFSVMDDSPLLPATQGIPETLLKAIEPFPLEQLRPYDPGFVSGWVVEQYQIDLVSAGDRTRADLAERAPRDYRSRCGDEVPETRYHSLVVTATTAVKTFRHLLLPVWMVHVVRGGRTTRVVINGATGTVTGDGETRRTGRWVLALLLLLAGAGLVWVLR